MAKKPKIAIIGRPNVGKSTLFNRLAGKRTSIVDQLEGVTRDRIYSSAEWLSNEFDIIDTGGFVSSDEDIFNQKIKEQISQALGECDGLIFLVDGKEGINPNDHYLSKLVRRSGKKYVLAVNKCDVPAHSDRINSFFDLGLDKPTPISAMDSAPDESSTILLSIAELTFRQILPEKDAFINPETTFTDGLCVVNITDMPAALPF